MYAIKCRCGAQTRNFKHNIGEYYMDRCCEKAGFDHEGNMTSKTPVYGSEEDRQQFGEELTKGADELKAANEKAEAEAAEKVKAEKKSQKEADKAAKKAAKEAAKAVVKTTEEPK